MSHADPTSEKRRHGTVSFTVEDIKAGRVHVISDTHFGHSGIVKLAQRPGHVFGADSDVLAHEQLITSNWNACTS
jgi:calcineurin-like phosphoesterase family protein